MKDSKDYQIGRLERKVQNAELALKVQKQNCDNLREQLAEARSLLRSRESMLSKVAQGWILRTGTKENPIALDAYQEGMAYSMEDGTLLATLKPNHRLPKVIDATSEQSQFEMWVNAVNWLHLDRFEQPCQFVYQDGKTEAAWDAWSARALLANENIEIEDLIEKINASIKNSLTPNPPGVIYTSSDFNAIDDDINYPVDLEPMHMDFQRNLEQAGIEFKIESHCSFPRKFGRYWPEKVQELWEGYRDWPNVK